jgi:hypothetical protein
MSMWQAGFAFCLSTGFLAAAGPGGIPPRGGASEYPAHAKSPGFTVAAAALGPEQASKLFAIDLNKQGYIVFEVAVYPEPASEVNIQARDFLLRVSSDPATLRPVSASLIAGRIQQKNAPKPPKTLPGDVQVYSTTTIGYESGGYDPATGRRASGVYTGTGVGVAVGAPPPPPAPPRPGATDQDRDAIEQDLDSKALPEVKTVDPVAGYLFFPKPASKAKGTYRLTCYGEHGQVNLEIPVPK